MICSSIYGLKESDIYDHKNLKNGDGFQVGVSDGVQSPALKQTKPTTSP